MFDIPIVLNEHSNHMRSNLWNLSTPVHRNLIEGTYTDIHGNSTLDFQVCAVTKHHSLAGAKETYPDYEDPKVNPAPKLSRFHSFFKEDYQVNEPEGDIREAEIFPYELSADFDFCLEIPTMTLDEGLHPTFCFGLKQITQYPELSTDEDSDYDSEEHLMEPKIQLLNPEDFTYGLGPYVEKNKKTSNLEDYRSAFAQEETPERAHLNQFWNSVFDDLEEKARNSGW